MYIYSIRVVILLFDHWMIMIFFRTVDPSLMESISSLIWCSAMLESDIPELKVISDLFAQKYGKKYAEVINFRPWMYLVLNLINFNFNELFFNNPDWKK